MIGGRSFDPAHIAAALTMNGKNSFSLNEGPSNDAIQATVNADMNPKWVSLTTDDVGFAGTYNSVVTFDPKVKVCGVLLHFYSMYRERFFFDVKSALLRVRTQVKITEEGGGDGVFDATNDGDGFIKSFEIAVNRSNWNYAKIGEEQKRVGLDNIQFTAGMVHRFDWSEMNDNVVAGYLLFEIPTGRATKSKWMFEPRVGHNHFALGLGVDQYYVNESTQLVVGANWRYLLGAQETRTFDLKNKPWSRYMRVVPLPSSVAVPNNENAVNAAEVLTLNATVKPGHEVNTYLRWTKKCENKINVELGYNFLYQQREQISGLADFPYSFGIDYLYTPNGKTLNDATIDTARTFVPWAALAEDPGEAIPKTDVDLNSAARGTVMTSSLSGKFEYVGERFRGGLGVMFEGAHTQSAYASWNAWANLGYMF